MNVDTIKESTIREDAGVSKEYIRIAAVTPKPIYTLMIIRYCLTKYFFLDTKVVSTV